MRLSLFRISRVWTGLTFSLRARSLVGAQPIPPGGSTTPTVAARDNGRQNAVSHGDDADVVGVNDDEFQAAVGRYEADRLRQLIIERLEAADVALLDAVCSPLEIDPLLEWSLSAAFLRLHDRPRLDRLAAELGVDLSPAQTPLEAISILEFEDPVQTPASILKVHNLDLEPAPA